MSARENKSGYLIQTVCHALDLLDQFNCGREELGVSELSRRMALHKNNVFRLLATLESRNFVEQNSSTGNYRLGLKNLEMGQTFSRHLGMRMQARPVIEALSCALKETCGINVMKGTSIITLDVVETTLPVRVVANLGAWLPLHCTAPGKVFLAAMQEKERKQLLQKELQHYTPFTMTVREELITHLGQVTTRGYALDDEELELGVRCVSAPVYDSTMQVTGAISVTGPANRMGDERLQSEIVPMILRSAAELSRRMGGSHQ